MRLKFIFYKFSDIYKFNINLYCNNWKTIYNTIKGF